MDMLPRCVFVLDEPFYESDGDLYCGLTWWRFGDHLAAYTSRATLYVPMKSGMHPPEALPVRPERIEIAGRLFYCRTEEFYRRVWRRRRQMITSAKKLFNDHEVIVLRTPSPICRILARLAWELRKPTVLFVAGDVCAANTYAGKRGIKAILARRVAAHLRSQELAVASRSAMVAVWGRDLLPVFSGANGRTALASAPNLSVRDIHRRTEKAINHVIKLVRVTRVLPNKGIEYLLDAVAQLRRSGREVCLDIVGGADDPGYQRQLLERCRHQGITEHVRFQGVIEFGPRLFDFYRAADIHVISSLSEGLPRCVVEGRAMGLPTIATRVGGLPTVIRHEVDGLLVEPGSAVEIAGAIERLVEDESLRRRIVEAGYKCIETYTAEYQARRLAGLISCALGGHDINGWGTDLARIEPVAEK